jgi:hypothetical protein
VSRRPADKPPVVAARGEILYQNVISIQHPMTGDTLKNGAGNLAALV